MSPMDKIIAICTTTYLRVADQVQQLNNIWTAGQVLQDANLALNLLLLDGLQHLDDALLVVARAHASEHLRVLAAADFAHNLVVVHVATI